MVYEYIITFSEEVQLFWRRKPTGAIVLFLLNRYLLLFAILMPWIPATAEVCALL